MPKTTQKQPLVCPEHEFLFTPTSPNLYFKQPVSLSFCKQSSFPKCKHIEKRSKATKSSGICCPIFNKDKNYSTSSFILPEERKTYIENQLKYKNAHQSRIKELNEQKSELFIPRPKLKHPFCNVCRVAFTDYLQHTKSKIHRMSVEATPYNYFINEIAAKYDKMNKSKSSFSKKTNSNESTQSGYQSDPEIQALGAPTKKVKKQYSFSPSFCYPLRVGQITDGTILPIGLANDFVNQGISQFPSFSNINKNEMFPVISTMSSIPYQPMNFALGVDTNMRLGFPMLYCNSFTSFQQIPQSYYTIPFLPSLQKIQTSQKIEQVLIE